MTQYRVLFVCLGNICRSPTAEGVFRKAVSDAGRDGDIAIASAGTGGWHIGNPPDGRAQEAALRRGIDLSDQTAQQVGISDFGAFDLILAMDRDNLDDLRRAAPASALDKIKLFLDFAPDQAVREVPDPYYGGPGGFDDVLDLVEIAAGGLLEYIDQELSG